MNKLPLNAFLLGISVLSLLGVLGCGKSNVAAEARPWNEIATELRAQGDVVFASEPQGLCKLHTPVASGNGESISGKFGESGHPGKFSFEGQLGKYIVVYPVTSANGVVTPVAVYKPTNAR